MITEDVAEERCFADYRAFKAKYYSLLSTRRLPRGKSRAFVGATFLGTVILYEVPLALT